MVHGATFGPDRHDQARTQQASRETTEADRADRATEERRWQLWRVRIPPARFGHHLAAELEELSGPAPAGAG
jgi:hypothetical protein